jgi:hypothetical protein
MVTGRHPQKPKMSPTKEKMLKEVFRKERKIIQF